MKCETYMLQNKDEVDKMARIFIENGVKSYLEVGSKFGGSLWRVANALPVGSKVVSVDLPQGDTSFKDTKPHLEECVRTLKKRGYDAQVIFGDSTNPGIVEAATKEGPFDAVFLDGNHTLPYIKKDWENYSKITKILAFHDIGFFREGGMAPGKKPIEVPVFWNRIKENYKHVEIKYDKQDNGIGILWL